jgi:hypothetical protein
MKKKKNQKKNNKNIKTNKRRDIRGENQRKRGLPPGNPLSAPTITQNHKQHTITNITMYLNLKEL